MTPTSLADADEQRRRLTTEVQELQAQLGDRQRSDNAGRRLGTQEYWSWKRQARDLLTQKLTDLREVKDWIRDNRHALPPGPLSPDAFAFVGQLESLYLILRDLRNEDVDFDQAEIDKIEAARMLLAVSGTFRQRELYAQDQDQAPIQARSSG